MVKPVKNTPDEPGIMIPGSDEKLGIRIFQVVELYDGRESAAKVAGKSVDQLRGYIKGRNKAPFDVLVNLAREKGVRLEWLASGEGKMFSGLQDGGDVWAIQVPTTDRAAGDQGPVTQSERYGYFLERLAGVYAAAGIKMSLRELGQAAARDIKEIEEVEATPERKLEMIDESLARTAELLKRSPGRREVGE